MKAKNANAPSPYPLPVGEGKKRQRDWIPDLVGNDRLGRAGMTERGRGACGVSAPHAEGGRMWGVAPTRRGSFALLRTGSFVSAKGPKTMGARAWPFGCLCHGPDFLGCGTRFAQTVLASISASGLGRSRARRRLEVAPFDGALRLLKTKAKKRRWIPAFAGMTEFRERRG